MWEKEIHDSLVWGLFFPEEMTFELTPVIEMHHLCKDIAAECTMHRESGRAAGRRNLGTFNQQKGGQEAGTQG